VRQAPPPPLSFISSCRCTFALEQHLLRPSLPSHRSHDSHHFFRSCLQYLCAFVRRSSAQCRLSCHWCTRHVHYVRWRWLNSYWLAVSEAVAKLGRCLVCLTLTLGHEVLTERRKANLDTIQNSCQAEGWGPNNSDAETQAIKDSIIGESKSSGIPKVGNFPRPFWRPAHAHCSQEFILAIVMQESKGCVRAPTTRWSHDNPGLMQSAQGTGTCNPNGNPISPCSSTEIRQMIHDGTNGDGLETTLTQCVADAGTTDDSKWYKAARLYNAGKITDNNLGIGPTPCYASDIANRLTSPFDGSPCDNTVIGSLSSAQGTVANANTNDTPDEPAPTTTTTVEPASTTTAAAGYSASPAVTPTQTPGVFAEAPATTAAKPDLVIDGAATGCIDYYTPQSGDSCASAPVDFATLRSLNTQLNSDCTNFWAGYAYCIAA
jgi:hypothetical protein